MTDNKEHGEEPEENYEENQEKMLFQIQPLPGDACEECDVCCEVNMKMRSCLNFVTLKIVTSIIVTSEFDSVRGAQAGGHTGGMG